MWTSLSAREVLGSISGQYRPSAQLLSAQAIGVEGLGSIPGPVKSAQCRQRLATAASFLSSPGAKSRRWATVAYPREGGREGRASLPLNTGSPNFLIRFA